METYRKNRLLFWTLIFLIVVNLSAVATFFFFPRGPKPMRCEDNIASPGCIYQTQLDLTDEQTKKVDSLSEDYQQISRPIADQIKNTREQMLEELSADKPDTLVLNELSRKLSQLQGRLQHENMKHYLALKEVCTPDQALRLSNLYRELYGCPMQGPGKGMQHRHKRSW